MSPRIFSIPPGLPFLPRLAGEILAGRLVPGLDATGDPLALAGLTVFVPTRRAARSLTGAFATGLGGGSAILPRVRVLGEPDEMGALLAPGSATAGLAPVMGGLERRLHLARLVRFWKSELAIGAARTLAAEDIVLPASAADALFLAADLCALLDEVADEEIDLGGLRHLGIEDRLAAWWQLTLTFLAILTEHWPAFLNERGMMGPGEARNAWARQEAARYRERGSADPVVIAGSTATAPATLDLMRAVAELANGAVVLPGLDGHLDGPSFARIDRAASVAAPGHPQHGLKRMLAGLGAGRDAVTRIEGTDAALTAREAFLSDALRPAETTDAWSRAHVSHDDDALEGLALVEAEDEREEALAIAVAMRDALSDPTATVALTTPDRNLARRVVVELERFGIAANDSAGRPLLATAPGSLTLSALEAALAPGDPVALLSLLKHPLTRLGLPGFRARRAARTLEIVALRGGTGRADAATLADLYAARLAAIEADPRRASRAIRLISSEERQEGLDFARRLHAALGPLVALRGSGPGEIEDFAGALTRSLEALARDEADDPTELYAREAGAALAAFLSEIAAAPATGFAFAPAELPDAVRALAGSLTVRPRYSASQRAFVWGALEARLQNVDTMILGGLNEGTWPQGARSDAFLSRLMRAEMLLDPPERRIGLAAHDIWMAMGSRRVILTRSLRAGSAPAIASRWLQRIATLAGPTGLLALRERGRAYLSAARGLDAAETAPRAARPEPRPPLEARPLRYSVTEVETLIRDPYAVHARRVLRLEPLEPLLRDPGAAERGNLYHRILARFVTEAVDPAAPDAEARLAAIAAEEFAAEALPPEIEAVWWPRMETLCRNTVAWERERDPRVATRHAEIRGEWLFPDLGLRLTGFADRIDAMTDGSLEILDFKTGSNPSMRQARTLLAPQLPLEGAMARLGAFEAEGIAKGTHVSELLYVRLRERDFYEERLSHPGGKSAEPIQAEALADGALAKFREIGAAYRDPARGFTSRARPLRAGDHTGPYDHLARALEWGTAGEDAGDEAQEGQEGQEAQ